MGMPLYGAQPPTGYSMKAETWVSSSALLNRMNFALALTSGKIKGAVNVSRGMLEFRADPESPYHDKSFDKGKNEFLSSPYGPMLVVSCFFWLVG